MEKAHIGGFLIGLGLGGALGVLFAPHAGKKTRTRIAKAATNGANYAKDYGETVSETVSDCIDRTNDELTRHKEGVAEAIKRGTRALQQLSVH